MRPALQALAEQQKLIDSLNEYVSSLTEYKTQSQAAINQLHVEASRKDAQIKQLTRGLAAVASLTGLDAQVRTAIFKRADEQNPAQPVPDPAPEAPLFTTQEAETPEAYADVRAPGLVSGTNQDTAADAVTTTYTPGGDIPSPALNQLDDVTRPVDGTQGPRPLGETKTLTDVRVGDPMNAQVAFPVNGPFSQSQRTSSQNDGSARAAAAMRLASLRVEGGMSESGDQMVEFDSIIRDASLSDDAINQELSFFSKQKTAKSVEAPRNLVPRSAVQRTVPSLGKMTRSASLEVDDDASILFLGDLS